MFTSFLTAVSSMAEWQEAIDSDGFDALLYRPTVFEEFRGFCPSGLTAPERASKLITRTAQS